MGPHYIEHRSQIAKMFIFVAAFDGDIINIAFDRLPEMIAEDHAHRPLVGCSGVLQSEGHYSVAVYPQRRSERSMLLVVGIHLDLIVP